MGKITRATLSAILTFWKGCVYKLWHDAKVVSDSFYVSFFGSVLLLVKSIFAASGFLFVQDGRSVGFVK